MTPFTGDESKTLQVSHSGAVGSGSQLSGILKPRAETSVPYGLGYR